MNDVPAPDAPADDGDVPSPCVKVCTLMGDVCIGCGRTIGEIAAWSAMDAGRKRQVAAAARARRAARRGATTG